MAQLDSHARDKCSVCGRPYYDPEQGAVKDYRYTTRPISDSHRVMLHSGDERDLNYDPDYFAAFDRLEKRTRDNIARSWAQYDEGHSRVVEITRKALGSTTEEPDLSGKTGATHAD